MTNLASVPRLETRFNDFLFASVAEDNHGMTLSVLSALARRDVDPREEAAKLASLPGETAISRLATLITPLPVGPAATPDPRMIAARLIALLPPHSSSDTDLRSKIKTISTVNGWWLIIAVGFMFLVLSAQIFLAIHQPAAKIDVVHAHAAPTASKAASPLEAADAESSSQPRGID